ncbi:MAG TPA: autotransporter-associated beta strand repeat-containing protein [Chthoniobacteraceae bacterium]|nr:autotransporter-associated beta strand repeat-containing protein [Chthoniobacteraceae bacterium]
MDDNYTDGSWLGGWGNWYAPDTRGYWIETVYRPVDINPALSGSQVSLYIYPTDDTWTSVPTLTNYTIDANYLVGFAHIEGYAANVPNYTTGSRVIYSTDNGVTWLKGPIASGTSNGPGGYPVNTMGGGGIDARTNPASPRLVSVSRQASGFSSDIMQGIQSYTTGTNNFNPGDFEGSNGLLWSRYLGMWLVPYTDQAATTNNQCLAVTSDFSNIYYSGLPAAPLCNYDYPENVEEGIGNYPRILGGFPYSSSGYPIPYDMEIGQMGWLYNNCGGLCGRAIAFVDQPAVSLTWTGSGGDINLGTLSNWVLTGSTAHPGSFTDEADVLNFTAVTGGTLYNDLPATMRVRALIFGPSSGSYMLSGDNLELEAVNGGEAYHHTIDGIALQSSNSTTISNGIDVRTAALYVRNSGTGVLTLSGGIDMRGSGGIVVSGSGSTTLSGGIQDTGYVDFLSGSAEFIASANEGRLIMDGGPASTLTLSGSNNFQGRTDVDGGTIAVNNPYALENSVVTLNVNGGLTPGVNLYLGGLNGSGNVNIGGYMVTLGNNNPPNCYATDYTGQLSGNGGVVKTGSNTQIIGGHGNNYFGGTDIQSGVLEVANGSLGAGMVTFDGGTLEASDAIVASNAVQVNSGGGVINANGFSVTINGSLSGNGSLVSTGGGTLILGGSNASYSGTLFIGNNVVANTSSALGTGNFEIDGGQLSLGANLTMGTITATGTSGTTTLDTGGYTLTMTGAINIPSGDLLTVMGGGNVLWSGTTSEFLGSLMIQGNGFTATQQGTAVSLNGGSVTVSGGQLGFEPSGSGLNAGFLVASSAGTTLSLEGVATLVLNQGANTSLTVTIGGSNALALSSSCALMINSAAGVSGLGQSNGDTLLVNGLASSGSNIYAANLVVSGTDNVGDFASYSGSTGFVQYAGYVTHSGTYSQTSSTTTEVADVTGSASLTASSYAQDLRIAGTNVLTIGSSKSYTMKGTSGEASVLLNGGAINLGTLAFGSNAGFIYASGTTGVISSVISGSGMLTVFGASGSVVKFTGTNTFSNSGLRIYGATLSISGIGALGGYPNTYTLDAGGALDATGGVSIGRNIDIGPGGGTIDVASGQTFEINDTGNGIYGSGMLQKTGLGTLDLQGANPSTGGYDVQQGVIVFAYSGGVDSGGGPLIVAAGASAHLTTYSGYGLAHSLQLSGTGPSGEGAITFVGGGLDSNPILITGNTRIGVGLSGYNFTGVITDPGYNLELSGSGGQASLQGCAVTMDAGNLSITGTSGALFDAATTVASSGTLSVAAASSLELDGAISGPAEASVSGLLTGSGGALTTADTLTINNGGGLAAGTATSGTAAVPACFTVNGNLALSASSNYQSYVSSAAGAAPGSSASGYGQVIVTGTGTVNGTLTLVCNAGYTPHTGDQIFVMLRNAGSGQFSGVTVISGTNTPANYSGSEGATIPINGVNGALSYVQHDSIDLTEGSSDIVIQF